VISKTAGIGSFYEFAKAAGFVSSGDFTDGLFSSVYKILRAVGVQWLSDLFCHVISKAVCFVLSRDFTGGLFSSVTRSHRRSAFSGCWLCSEQIRQPLNSDHCKIS